MSIHGWTVLSCSFLPHRLGTCTGVVINTGDRTVIGRIARLTGSIVEESKQPPRSSKGALLKGCFIKWVGAAYNLISFE